MVNLFELIGKDPPSSEIVNRTFDLFVHTLNNKISRVHRVKHLYYPGTAKQFASIEHSPLKVYIELWGLQMTDRIYISRSCDKEDAIRTLIHELAHFLFQLSDRKKSEEIVMKIERRLWRSFSETQKNLLWKYVPRKITLENVDNEPK